MNGYLRDAAATAGAFTRDGWLKTGDMAQRDDDGNFRLVGRIKEMYKSGGYNVYPREIEVVLEQHPNVLMSAVIAVDDELYQQVGHAHLISGPTPRCRNRSWCSGAANAWPTIKCPSAFSSATHYRCCR